MKKALFNVFLVATGAAIGSLVTWKIVKTKYERIIQEEIDSVKETWGRLGRERDNDETCDEEECLDDEEDDDQHVEDEDDQVMVDYAALARKYSRSSDRCDEPEKKGEKGIDDAIDGPYVIEPGDFGDGNYDHELHCITYYADSILADDWWVKLDIEETIGEEALEHFGDYAEDVVHVRNERLRRDYEVTRDPRNYVDVVTGNPLAPNYAD